MTNNGIGTRKESSLHAALKAWYAQPGDLIEADVDGYVIDLARGDLLIEIQTGNFTALRRKLTGIVEGHRVRVVYPIPVERYIVRIANDGEALSRRKSPKRGRIEALFTEMVRMPRLALHPNFSLEVALVREETIWRDDGQGSWRRKGWSIADRRLLEVVEQIVFDSPADYRRLLPESLVEPFTARDLATAAGLPRALAGKMAYTLREMGQLTPIGKRGRSLLYSSEI